MSESTSRQDMLSKVQKLLAKAESVAGTPEADTLNAKAFELIAKYGIDETQARQRTGEGPAPIQFAEFVITGQYQWEQIRLFHALAEALHCSPLTDGRDPNQRKQIVWGVAVHIERLRVLFATLMPQMLAGASRVQPHPGARVGTKAYRTTWMRGFRGAIKDRLTAAEKTAADQAAPGTALVLVDDAQRAETTMRTQFAGRIRTTKTTFRHDQQAADMGSAAGHRVDLGQTGLHGQRAIGR